ncbi:MAG: helix-hairpin-helix domain-containing protein, partial [Bacteroidales bacterium]
DEKSLTAAPGVGKKIAQRMILELQGTLKTSDAFEAFAIGDDNHPLQDAAGALEAMGFSGDEISAALKGCTESDTSAIIRYALKHVGGAA